jgi:hypothetical protein
VSRESVSAVSVRASLLDELLSCTALGVAKQKGREIRGDQGFGKGFPSPKLDGDVWLGADDLGAAEGLGKAGGEPLLRRLFAMH